MDSCPAPLDWSHEETQPIVVASSHPTSRIRRPSPHGGLSQFHSVRTKSYAVVHSPAVWGLLYTSSTLSSSNQNELPTTRSLAFRFEKAPPIVFPCNKPRSSSFPSVQTPAQQKEGIGPFVALSSSLMFCRTPLFLSNSENAVDDYENGSVLLDTSCTSNHEPSVITKNSLSDYSSATKPA